MQLKAISYRYIIVKDLLPDHVAFIDGFYNVKEPEVKIRVSH